jgi:protein involved in polysaccharide export with SLBB domain
LPAEFRAPPPHGVKKIDLTSFACQNLLSDVVYEGDLLEVIIATGREQEEPLVWTVRVDQRGVVQLPLVGGVRVAGLDLNAARHAVRSACIERGIYRHPVIAIRVEERHSNQVTVLGEVEVPGVYLLPRRSSDLVSALAAAEGLTEDADAIVEIRQPPPWGVDYQTTGTPPSVQPAGYQPLHAERGESQSVRVDLAGAAASGDRHYLEDGAVVLVRRRPGRTIHVMGLVNEADQFELPADDETRVLDAVAMAGGRTLGIANQVRIVRQVPGSSDPVIIRFSLRDAQRDGVDNLPLAPGDLVIVEQTPATFVVEAVRNLIRFGFGMGMNF